MPIVKKLKIAIVSLTSCEGCEVAFVDLGKKLLDILERVEVADFKFLKDEEGKGKKVDLVFVEGSPITKEDIKKLQEARARAKVLIVIGNCAALGGVPEIKNYQKKVVSRCPLPPIKTVGDFVCVDFTVPGCPITNTELSQIIGDILNGKGPSIVTKPVCYECQNNQYDCLLQKREICFGPITLGGCKAICLKSRQGCWGCRGILSSTVKNENISNLMEKLKKEHSLKNIEEKLEVFGVKDGLERKIIEDGQKIK